jgi:hypothetical protein
VPEDWSHHHVVFSSPGTLEEAAKNGTFEKWSRIVSDPRYQMQQRKRQIMDQRREEWRKHRTPTLKTDWNMDLGSGASVGAGHFPAKFTFSTTTASCSDWVVFNTGAAGVSGGQANIVAYSNLYNTTCAGTVPAVAWAYYSGTGKALTGPAISFDGTKMAYIENPTSGAAVLRIVAWQSGQGTATASVTPTKTYTNTTVGASGNTTWNTTNCPAGDSCLISVAFQNGDQDTNSAPFYDYDGSDTLWVGDNSGQLHKFTGVFNGTPAEVVTGGWPISVSSNILTSPVYDNGASGNIFVADSGGFLYSYKASGPTHEMTSSKLTYASGTVGIVDAPLVDSSTEEVYVFVGRYANTSTSSPAFNCQNTTGCSGVFQFSATATGTGSGACNATSATSWGTGTNCGHEAVFGVGTAATPSEYDGSFDHIYQSGSGTTGNLWVCSQMASSEPRLSYAQMSAFVPSGDVIGIASTAIATLTGATASCSPVTEIYGSDGTANDYIFLGVTNDGNQTGTTCSGSGASGACVYNFIVSTNGTSTTVPSSAHAGIAASGGSSGTIIDNNLNTSGNTESQIYYSNLTNTSCTGSGGSGSGTGGCAVQASQTAP